VTRAAYLLVLVFACACTRESKWSSNIAELPDACIKAKQSLAALPDSALFLGSLSDNAWRQECVPTLRAAITPCFEYDPGTDSAITCLHKYMGPAMQYAMLESCSKHALKDEVKRYCELQAANLSGDPVRIQAAIVLNKDLFGGPVNALAGDAASQAKSKKSSHRP
jgi:hypothetical protein